jgi:quercetin dioxygenase-like cupin family protein
MSPPKLPEGIVEKYDLSDAGSGFTTDCIFRENKPDGFSLVNIRLAPNSILPTHKHDTDCLYYVLSGTILLGRQELGMGAGFMVPADRPYGYRAGANGAAVLEIRKATSFNMIVTQTSPQLWEEITATTKRENCWPGFVESVKLQSAVSRGQIA